MKQLISVFLIFQMGCASILSAKREEIRIESDPPESMAYVNGNFVGMTPVSVWADKTQNHTIEIRKEGYLPQTRVVTSSVGAGWIILDVFFGLIPLVVDASTGEWKSLDQMPIKPVLQEIKK